MRITGGLIYHTDCLLRDGMDLGYFSIHATLLLLHCDSGHLGGCWQTMKFVNLYREKGNVRQIPFPKSDDYGFTQLTDNC